MGSEDLTFHLYSSLSCPDPCPSHPTPDSPLNRLGSGVIGGSDLQDVQYDQWGQLHLHLDPPRTEPPRRLNQTWSD